MQGGSVGAWQRHVLPVGGGGPRRVQRDLTTPRLTPDGVAYMVEAFPQCDGFGSCLRYKRTDRHVNFRSARDPELPSPIPPMAAQQNDAAPAENW
jgi:hypothetical protein